MAKKLSAEQLDLALRRMLLLQLPLDSWDWLVLGSPIIITIANYHHHQHLPYPRRYLVSGSK